MMTEKNKMECDDLLKTHEMTQKLLDANIADAAMLATLIQMAAEGKTRWRCICFTISSPTPLKSQRAARKRTSRKSTLTPCSAKQQKLGGFLHRVFCAIFANPSWAVRARSARTEFLSIYKLHKFLDQSLCNLTIDSFPEKCYTVYRS